MENKKLLIRRAIYIAAVIGSLVFITLNGGNLPYMFFYLLVVNAVVSIVYINYVFYSIRISQSIKDHMIDKEKQLDMKFEISNESRLAFSSIKINFLDDFSHVSRGENLEHIGIDSKDSIKLDLSIICNYSGMYYAGVDTIEIMDYFGIFKMKFDMPQKMKLYVKPRILEVNRLRFLDEYEDTVNSSSFSKSDAIVDNQVREFEISDDKNMIHWRNSAKLQKLMVRTYSSEEAKEYLVMLDGNVTQYSEYERVVILDRMREAYVSIINYILNSGYFVECLIDDVVQDRVEDSYTFYSVYENVAKYNFIKNSDIYNNLDRAIAKFREASTIIVISPTKATKDFKHPGQSIFWVDMSEYEDVEGLFN